MKFIYQLMMILISLIIILDKGLSMRIIEEKNEKKMAKQFFFICFFLIRNFS